MSQALRSMGRRVARLLMTGKWRAAHREFWRGVDEERERIETERAWQRLERALREQGKSPNGRVWH